MRLGVGGASLLKAPDEITLLDVYRAVDVVEEGQLFYVHGGPSPDCPVGRSIEATLRAEFAEAQAAMERRLEKTTLAQLALQFQ